MLKLKINPTKTYFLFVYTKVILIDLLLQCTRNTWSLCCHLCFNKNRNIYLFIFFYQCWSSHRAQFLALGCYRKWPCKWCLQQMRASVLAALLWEETMNKQAEGMEKHLFYYICAVRLTVVTKKYYCSNFNSTRASKQNEALCLVVGHGSVFICIIIFFYFIARVLKKHSHF